jgi:hypothetical protein
MTPNVKEHSKHLRGALQAGTETCIVATDPVRRVGVTHVATLSQWWGSGMLVGRTTLVHSSSGSP